MTSMIITTALVLDDQRKFKRYDVIPYQNDPWIVIDWTANEDGKTRRAKRLIRLSKLRFQKGTTIGEVMVNTVIPQAVLEGREKPAEGSPIEIVEVLTTKTARVDKVEKVEKTTTH